MVNSYKMKKILFLISIIFTIVLLSGCLNIDESNVLATINGNVVIEPMCPVEPCDLTPKELENLYGARKIIIYTADTSEVVQRVAVLIDGTYSTNLPVGKYIVDINYYGDDLSSDVPKEVELIEGFVTTLNININSHLQ